jgi:hypothetical protein
MQMPGTTRKTLAALTAIDSGQLRVRLDESVYSQDAVKSFLSELGPHVVGSTERINDGLWLRIEASDPSAARLQIGNALTDLLRLAIRERP